MRPRPVWASRDPSRTSVAGSDATEDDRLQRTASFLRTRPQLLTTADVNAPGGSSEPHVERSWLSAQTQSLPLTFISPAPVSHDDAHSGGADSGAGYPRHAYGVHSVPGIDTQKELPPLADLDLEFDKIVRRRTTADGHGDDALSQDSANQLLNQQPLPRWASRGGEATPGFSFPQLVRLT
jgi:hypothetical protein